MNGRLSGAEGDWVQPVNRADYRDYFEIKWPTASTSDHTAYRDLASYKTISPDGFKRYKNELEKKLQKKLPSSLTSFDNESILPQDIPERLKALREAQEDMQSQLQQARIKEQRVEERAEVYDDEKDAEGIDDDGDGDDEGEGDVNSQAAKADNFSESPPLTQPRGPGWSGSLPQDYEGTQSQQTMTSKQDAPVLAPTQIIQAT